MKILFVNPSLRPGSEHKFLPVGLGYVMTYVKSKGYSFELLDIDVADYSDENVEKYFIKNKFDVVCIGSIVTHYKWVKWFINTVKKHQPSAQVVVGNSVGGSIPEVLFQTTKVDIVIYGEAELTIVELFEALNTGKSFGEINEPHVEIPHPNLGYPATLKGTGIEGLIYRSKEGLIINNGKRKAVKDIDTFPFPDWEIFDVSKYLDIGRKLGASKAWFYKPEDAIILPINTARGCVFKCTFCHYVFWHDPYRHRSAENVIAEIKQNQKKYNANFFNFWDELSFHKIGPAKTFVDKLIEADLKIHWTGAIRADLMGKDVDAKGKPIPREDRLDLARKFVKSGCVSAGYSLESGSDKILESMNKRVQSKYFKEQVHICREAGLTTDTSVIIGYPEETKETIAETYSKLHELKVYPSTGYLIPLPETGMWKHALENGYIGNNKGNNEDIKNIDDYLTQITERQDFSLNLTKMTDEELKNETLQWLSKLNKDFGINLDESKLIKTGGEDESGKNQTKDRVIPDNIVERNQTTDDSLNYATAKGTMR